MDKRKTAGLQRSLFSCLKKYEIFLKHIVDEYSLIECLITYDFQPANVISNDYFCFCVAKSCKTLIAINILLNNKLPEDAMVLLRSSYESYLHIVFSVDNYLEIDKLVSYKVGLHSGVYRHPKTKKGKKDYNKIIIHEGNDPIDFGVTVAELANKTGYDEDKYLHHMIYSYLSEFSHPHFMASGSYRVREGVPRYSYNRTENTLETAFLSTYIYTLILSCVITYECIDEGTISYFREPGGRSYLFIY